MTATDLEYETDAEAVGVEPPRPAPPRPPKPPRRMPRAQPELVPLTTGQAMARGIAAMVAAVMLMFVVNLMLFSPIQHLASQQRLVDAFRADLTAGTAPVSEGDFNDVLLADGAPVALLSIPKLGLNEVVVEGTSAATLTGGPGHLRSTMLPGQAGVSVIMARAAAYGGPFGGIQSLGPGDTIRIRTGQGLQKFEVMGVRYAGEPTPPAPVRGESRLILQTARGPAFMPSGIAYLDAKLVGDAEPAGARQTTTLTLPPEDRAMAIDLTTVWALVFALQFLVVAEVAAVWAFRRVGAQKTWIVFLPVLLLAGFFVADQVTRLLPNLL